MKIESLGFEKGQNLKKNSLPFFRQSERKLHNDCVFGNRRKTLLSLPFWIVCYKS